MKYLNMEVEYEILRRGATAPTRKHKGDAGIDFYTEQNVIIQPKSFRTVRTGITVRLPDGYNALLKPKGSNNHLVGAGVIENNYQGEVLFKLFNITEDQLIIRKGDAIGQMILLPALSPEPIKGKNIHTEKTNRGASGGITEQEIIE